jgi:hypothetical protein
MVPIGHHANAIVVARAFAAEASAQPALLFIFGPVGAGRPSSSNNWRLTFLREGVDAAPCWRHAT